MELEEAIVLVLIGGVAGWLAGLILKGGGFGLLGNIVIGVLGSFFGGWLFGVLGISVGSEWLDLIVTATVGALALLFLIRLVKRA